MTAIVFASGFTIAFIADLGVGVFVAIHDKGSAELIHAETLRTEAE